MTLREYMLAVHGPGYAPPRCYYCGGRAVTVDHRRPLKRFGKNDGRNVHPACRRCNSRKGPKSVAEFRAWLLRVDTAARNAGKSKRQSKAKPRPVRFYGEGARGAALKWLQALLGQVTLHGDTVVRVAPGARLTPKREPTERTRWRGRYTFAGANAVRALAKKTGCSPPTVERFVAGGRVNPENVAALTAALRSLGLSLPVLRALAPPRRNSSTDRATKRRG